MYLTYDEYCAHGGTAEQVVFNRHCLAASAQIDLLTHGRAHFLDPLPEEVKMAAFEGIERLMRRASEEAQGRMQSYSNDGMSISFAQETAQERELALNSAIVRYLWGVKAKDGKTPLLYAGVVV